MNSPHHPVWFIVKALTLLIGSTVCLWATSSNFDDTEIKAIGGIMVTWLGAESMGKRRKD